MTSEEEWERFAREVLQLLRLAHRRLNERNQQGTTTNDNETDQRDSCPLCGNGGHACHRQDR